MPAQPSIHLKTKVPTLYNFISPSSKLRWVNIHTTYFEPSPTTTIHRATNFYTSDIATMVFLVVCTKPNQPFENIYVLDMALPKTPNYVLMLKKLKKDLSIPPHPVLTKQTFCPKNSQFCLFHVCNYKGYNEPPTFNSSSKAN
jgi:hypothetical protein